MSDRPELTSSLVLAAAVAVLAFGCRRAPERTVRFSVGWLPTSSDPIELDQMNNVVAFSPVYSGLVSYNKAGEFSPMLAESWGASTDFTEWRFRMRSGMRFETGEPIGPAEVAASWRRLARLMEARGSRGTFLQKLSGMTADGSELRLRFREPQPHLLAAVSEAMFSAVPPSCYDAATGAWSCGRRAVSSGPYRVAAWNDTDFVIELREDFPATLRHPRPLRRVHYKATWRPERADVAFSASNRRPLFAEMTFHGGMESGVSFVRCASWRVPGGPCGRRAVRLRLREAFYRSLADRGFRPPRTFFPLLMPGISELPPPTLSSATLGGALVRVDRLPGNYDFADACNGAMAEAVSRLGGRAADVALDGESWSRSRTAARPSADIVYGSTEITPDQSASSVRFMFVSKEGIHLPDPTGRIVSILERDPKNFQSVNGQLWEDGLIWPIEHFAWGTWAVPDIDRSLLNTAIPSPRIQWVGWKD